MTFCQVQRFHYADKYATNSNQANETGENFKLLKVST